MAYIWTKNRNLLTPRSPAYNREITVSEIAQVGSFSCNTQERVKERKNICILGDLELFCLHKIYLSFGKKVSIFNVDH